MWRALLLTLLFAWCSLDAAARTRVVVADSPCSCRGQHGEFRWRAKTESDVPPARLARDHEVRPSDIGAWRGPGGEFVASTPRRGREREWYALTGRIVRLKLEPDGDLHVQLADVGTGTGPRGRDAVEVVAEVPYGEAWCEIRRALFALTSTRFPLETVRGRTLRLKRQPVVRVVGRAFYDAAHSGDDTTLNRRERNDGRAVAVWEIHPVMALSIASEK